MERRSRNELIIIIIKICITADRQYWLICIVQLIDNVG